MLRCWPRRGAMAGSRASAVSPAPRPPGPFSRGLPGGTIFFPAQHIGGCSFRPAGVFVLVNLTRRFGSHGCRRSKARRGSIARPRDRARARGQGTHGCWFRPASPLKVLTAISHHPALNQNDMVVRQQSRHHDSGSRHRGLLGPGTSYKVSDLLTALLTISQRRRAMAWPSDGSPARAWGSSTAEARAHARPTPQWPITPHGIDAPGQHRIHAYEPGAVARRRGLKCRPSFKYDRRTSSAGSRSARRKSVGMWNRIAARHVQGASAARSGWTSAAGATYVGRPGGHGAR